MSVYPIYRVTTFVPPERLEMLLEGVVREDPLTYGPYDRSAWWSAVGVEQFRLILSVQKRFSALRRPFALLDGPGGTQCPVEVIDAIAGYGSQ